MNVRLGALSVYLPGSHRLLFRLHPREISSGAKLLIHGPSGSGKTTLLHLIAGLFLPSEGYVFVEDQNLSFLSDEARCRLRRQKFGIVFQNLNLLPHLTALENVSLSLGKSTQKKEKSRNALAQLGMDAFENQMAAELSLGEQQRVAVARVLVAAPSIVLADEPTSGLDEANANAVASALLSLPGNPTTIVVSHDNRLRSHFKEVISFEEMVNA